MTHDSAFATGGGSLLGWWWLAMPAAAKGLNAEEAAEAVTSYAKAHGLSRRVDVPAVVESAAAAGAAKL
jgi:hypothetical protein